MKSLYSYWMGEAPQPLWTRLLIVMDYNIWSRLHRLCPDAAVVCCLLHFVLIKKLSKGYNHYKLQHKLIIWRDSTLTNSFEGKFHRSESYQRLYIYIVYI